MSTKGFFVIGVPLNADGDGPETDPDKIVRVEYQIWDQDFSFVAGYLLEEEAEYECLRLNQSI